MIGRLRSWGEAELLAVSTSALLWRALLTGAIVFALLAIYQPFGTHEARIPYKLWRLAGYGGITALAMAAVAAFARLLRGAAFKRWHLAAELVAALMVAGSGGYLYNALSFGTPLNWSAWGYFLKLALAIGVVPIALVLLAARERSDLVLQIPATPGTPASRCTLLGENRDEKLELAITDLLAIKAADNYSEVIFEGPGGIRRRLLRGSIRVMEQQLQGSGIARVHRSWLVNLARVQKWRGNAQGGQIEIAGLDESVPVARTCVARVRAALGHAA